VNVNQFDYHLPPEFIAQTPIEPRHASRLMVVNRQTGEMTHRQFIDLVDLLHPGDILIANDSRVIPARLSGHKTSGGKVEILLLKRLDDLRWEVLVGGKRLRPGVVVEIASQGAVSEGAEGPCDGAQDRQGSREEEKQNEYYSPSVLTLTIRENLGEARRLVEFNQPIDAWLDEVGQTPLPPYIHTTLDDAERYQTIFSRVDGSAAAPTAGLHFTSEILLALRDKGVILDYVTLHIGLDTFKPVTVEQVEAHSIHREFVRLTADTARRINQARLAGGRVVAVGTTAVRTLETAALRGAGQTGSLREASTLPSPSPTGMGGEEGGCPWKSVVAIEEETDLFIYPGFTFRAVDVLLTNFHLPKSTLLMLVSAFTGRELILRAYEEAIAEQYRFYSFGDAMLIL
jgi:S-adenosylmethionine:tRNA ribosyltransferase-isomerase